MHVFVNSLHISWVLRNGQCVWVCMLVTGLFPWAKHCSCFGLKSGTRGWCQTPRGVLTDVDRCMVPGLQLTKVIKWVDAGRLHILAIPPLHSKTSLVICCTLFLRGQKSTLTKYDSGAHCTTAACTCRPHPPQIRLGPDDGTVPALLFPELVESTRL